MNNFLFSALAEHPEGVERHDKPNPAKPSQLCLEEARQPSSVSTPRKSASKRQLKNLGSTTNPPTTRADTCRKRLPWVTECEMCVSFLFAMVSIKGSAGSGANASDPPARSRRYTLTPTCAPSHMWVTAKGRGCGRCCDLRGFHVWMTTVTPLRHD